MKTPRVFHLHRRYTQVGIQKAYVLILLLFIFCQLCRDSYTSMKLIKQRYLRAQIETINSKKSKSAKDIEALKKLAKELEPITEFLDEARQQRDAILEEIGIESKSLIFANV